MNMQSRPCAFHSRVLASPLTQISNGNAAFRFASLFFFLPMSPTGEPVIRVCERYTHTQLQTGSLSLPSAESAPMLIDQYGETALAIPGIRASSVVRRRSPPSPIKFSPLRVHFPCDVTRRGSCHFAPQNGRLGFFFCSHTQKRDAAQKISGRGGKYIKQHSKKKKPVWLVPGLARRDSTQKRRFLAWGLEAAKPWRFSVLRKGGRERELIKLWGSLQLSWLTSRVDWNLAHLEERGSLSLSNITGPSH